MLALFIKSSLPLFGLIPNTFEKLSIGSKYFFNKFISFWHNGESNSCKKLTKNKIESKSTNILNNNFIILFLSFTVNGLNEKKIH